MSGVSMFGSRTPKYEVVPKPKIRGGGNPDKWAVQKNQNTLSLHNKKSAAVRKAKRLAKQNNGIFIAFRSDMKGRTDIARFDR